MCKVFGCFLSERGTIMRSVDEDVMVTKELIDEDLRTRIKLIVSQIKSHRNRPSYQNIYDNLKKDDKYREIDKNSDLIPFIDSMVSEGHLLNTGKEKESFSVVSDELSRKDPEKSGEEDQLANRLNDFMKTVLDVVDNKMVERFLKINIQNQARHLTTP